MVIDMKLSSLLQDWFTLHAVGIKPRTRECYAGLLSRYILPALGDLDVNVITSDHIRHMLAAIIAEGHTRTAELVYVLCRLIFSELDIERDPMRRVKRPRHVQRRPDPWEPPDIRAYYKACLVHPHGLALSLALLLGLRRGEICGLRWEDVDFATARIHIRNQRIRLDTGKIVDAPPKSASSVRSIDLPAPLLARLEAARQPSGYVDPILPSSLDHAHSALVRRLGLPPIPLHGLRHTFASEALRNGAQMRGLQSILGHSSYTVTANIYTHPDAAMLAATIDAGSRVCYTLNIPKST